MTHRSHPRVALAAALLLHAGCLTSTQATRLQKDLDDVKRQLFEVQQDGAAARSRIEDVSRRLSGEASPGAQAEIQSNIRSLMEEVQSLSERVKESNSRMATLAAEIQSLRATGSREGGTGLGAPPPSLPKPGTAGGASPGPAGRAFNAAYADYSKGNYELAVMGFNEFLRAAPPDDPQAAEARYFVGECYYSQGKFKEAIESFDDVVRRDPGGEKVPAALLKKGYAQIEAGQTSPGVTTLQALIEAHPDSGEAKIAAGRLKELGLRSH